MRGTALVDYGRDSSLGGLDLLDELGNDLVQIADDAVGGNIEMGAFSFLLMAMMFSESCIPATC